MHKTLHPKVQEMTLIDYMHQERREEEDLPALKTAGRIDTMTRGVHKKVRRRTDYSYLKRYWQHEDQQNDNNQKTKMEKKSMGVLND